jgi:hypothetical protein
LRTDIDSGCDNAYAQFDAYKSALKCESQA